MQKPENITQEQWEHLMGHLQSQPKTKVTEEGTFQTRNLYSEQDLAERGAKHGIVQGWWNKESQR